MLIKTQVTRKKPEKKEKREKDRGDKCKIKIKIIDLKLNRVKRILVNAIQRQSLSDHRERKAPIICCVEKNMLNIKDFNRLKAKR